MGMAAASGTSRNSGYEVPRPAGVCAVSGRAIAPGERFVAALLETPTGLERLDVSMDCWAAFDRAQLLGFWQTVMPRGEEKKKVFVDDQVLCTLFERLAETQETNKLHFRFVLGLILMRKRLIVYEGRDGDVWIVRLKGKEEKLQLVDPKLDEQQVMQVSQQLGQILNEEL